MSHVILSKHRSFFILQTTYPRSSVTHTAQCASSTRYVAASEPSPGSGGRDLAGSQSCSRSRSRLRRAGVGARVGVTWTPSIPHLWKGRNTKNAIKCDVPRHLPINAKNPAHLSQAVSSHPTNQAPGNSKSHS